MVFAVRDEGLAGHGLAELPLPRLGARDAADLIADRGFAAELRDRIVAESAGNPLALLEFAAAAGSWPGAAPGAREPLPSPTGCSPGSGPGSTACPSGPG